MKIGKELIQLQKAKYRRALNSSDWILCKMEVFENDGWECVACGFSDNLIAHHWTYKYDEPLELDGMFTLCAKCHYILHLTYNVDRLHELGTERLFALDGTIRHICNAKESYLKMVNSKKKSKNQKNKNKKRKTKLSKEDEKIKKLIISRCKKAGVKVPENLQ